MFSEEVINSFPSYAVCDELACVPTLQEVRDVLSLIAGGKPGDSSGILPEMVMFVVMNYWGIWCSYLVMSGRVRLFHKIGVMHY